MVTEYSQNAFAKLAGVGLGLDLFGMFVPDVLHEVELGFVKSIFIHAIRLLNFYGNGGIGKLDER